MKFIRSTKQKQQGAKLKEVVKAYTQERIRLIRLEERLRLNPEYARRIGVSVGLNPVENDAPLEERHGARQQQKQIMKGEEKNG